jgi:hypothetical protein
MTGERKPYWVTIYTIIFICVYMLFFQNYWRWWNADKGQTPFEWDSDQYYSYLPAKFIHHDLDFKYTSRYWLITAPKTGKLVPKMTYGMALMYSPFFFIGHKIAINENAPLDGYSRPYGDMVHWGSLFYSLMGLIILGFVLKRFYSDAITAVTLVTIFFATNLFYYTMQAGEMPHAYCFFLISLLMWLTCKWHEEKKSLYFLWLGLTAGLLSLIRPTEILIALIFLLYGINSVAELKTKIKEIVLSAKNVPLFLLGFFIIWVPQLLFWKAQTGSYFFFSYGSKEQFFWGDPQIMNLLFSYRKGWFVYTPVMLFSIIGLFMLRDRAKEFKWAITIYMIINIYVLSCWWCWWFGGSFGMRALVQAYALLAIPLAAFYKYIFALDFKKQILTIGVKGLVVFLGSSFLCLNIMQTMQYYNVPNPYNRVLHYEAMSKAAYWRAFGKFNFSSAEDGEEFQKELIYPDSDAAQKGEKRD